jgi:hypothetical protein
MEDFGRLSKKSVAVLSLIAEGYSYSQIIDSHPGITFMDIFAAAREALSVNESPSDYHDRIARIKTEYPKAYTRWTDEEDGRLADMHAQGKALSEIAACFQRQPSAIRSRLSKQGLVSDRQNKAT